MTRSGTAGNPDNPVGGILSRTQEMDGVIVAMRAEIAAMSDAISDDQRSYHRDRLKALMAATTEMLEVAQGELDAEVDRRDAKTGRPRRFSLGRKSRHRDGR